MGNLKIKTFGVSKVCSISVVRQELRTGILLVAASAEGQRHFNGSLVEGTK
jgi:hypothetical protein